jgi:hypothetical protein
MKHPLSFSLLLFVCALTACQSINSPAAVAPAPADQAAPAAAAAAPAVDTTNTEAIWGQVPKQCACHADREPVATVASQLEYAQVPADFRLESTDQGFEIFSVRFNPSVVSPTRVTEVLKQAGAIILPGPPAGP